LITLHFLYLRKYNGDQQSPRASRQGDDNRERAKRLSPKGIGKAINFSPTLKQRHCFDALMARTGKTQARLGREAITMYLESQGFSKADQGIEE
jgi:predicted DNA-binding protein